MYRPPDIETVDDFHQYYRQSYIGWTNPKNDGKQFVPVLVRGMSDEDPRKIALRFEGEKADQIFSFKDILQNAQFGVPQYGSAEVGKSVVYVSRRSQRMAHRGHRPQGLHMHVFDNSLGEIPVPLLVWGEYLSSLFNPSYRSLDEAYTLLTTGERLACTLSRHFTMVLQEGIKVPCLYYKTKHVGYIPSMGVIEVENHSDHGTLVAETFSGVKIV
jgi:hypothetical protein